MSVLSLLSEEEKAAFISYIKNFGPGSGCAEDWEMNKSIDRIESADYLLRFWDMAKGRFLEGLFGDQLIKKIPIEYSTPREEIDFDALYRMPFNDSFINKCMNGMSKWYWRDGYSSYLPEDMQIKEYNADGLLLNADCKYCNRLHGLISDSDYAYDNIYSGPIFSIKLGDKSPLKIVEGMKWSKALGKVAEYIGLDKEEYEAFRKKHSLLINTKMLKGNLCLSIHPLDYITMSDATFSSCMSWMDKGGYRRGTVEMMNSDKVVVAYLESENESISWGDWRRLENNFHWNRKKWRILLIAEPGFVSSIKAYPYQNDELTVKALEALSDLYDEEFTSRFYDFDDGVFAIPSELCGEDEYRRIQYTTDAMYCDMGLSHHFIRFSGEPIAFDKSGYYMCNYSGPSECMFCGETHYEFADESCVFCHDCMSTWNDDGEYCYCASCGTRLYCDDANWLGDDPYCDHCFHDHANLCTCCGEYVDKCDTFPIIISYKGINDVSKITYQAQDELRNIHKYNRAICKNCVYNLNHLQLQDGYARWADPKDYEAEFKVPFDNLTILWASEHQWDGALKVKADTYGQFSDALYSNFNIFDLCAQADYVSVFNKYLCENPEDRISYEDAKKLLLKERATVQEEPVA